MTHKFAWCKDNKNNEELVKYYAELRSKSCYAPASICP